MSSPIQKRLADFGPFTFDFARRVLLRGEEVIDLSTRAVATLEYLIEHPDRWISKDDLMRKVWPDVSVSDSSVYRQISDIRRALGDSSRDPQFIEAVYGQGYRLLASVTDRIEFAVAVSANDSIEVFADVTTALSAAAAARHPLNTLSIIPSKNPIFRYIRYRGLAFLLAVVAIAGAALAYRMAPGREARVLESKQLTNDGKEKYGPLLIDGHRIFFTERVEGSWQVVSIPVSGGDASSLNIPLTNPSLQDISRDGSTLLLQSYEGDLSKLWTYAISSGVLRLVPEGFVGHAIWGPKSGMLAAATLDRSSILIFGHSVRKKIDLPGQLTSLKWSPDGAKLRFSVLDPKQDSSAIWELHQGAARPDRLPLASQGNKFSGAGPWSADGKYFFYETGSYLHQDIWVSRQDSGLFSFGPGRSFRLTSGEPGSWRWPSPSSDESTIFAINQFVRSELTRFDKSTNSWRPEWGGAAAYELDYSKDRTWVAYTHFPDHTIWKARADGGGRVRLTDVGLEAHQPHWSPDATRIAYMAKDKRGRWGIFQAPASGRVVEELLPGGEEQGVPTWSPDKRYLVFGDLLGRKPAAEMSIHLLNLSTRRITEVAGSKGLWSPRWSPDGRYITAITSDSEAIRVLTWPGMQWRELVRIKFVDNATWSADSRYVYFNGRDEALHRWLFRLAVSEGRFEPIADLADFPDTPENWFGVAPDGAPLAFRGVRTDEIFALKCVLP